MNPITSERARELAAMRKTIGSAQLTGFPNLAKVNDPERIERLVAAAESSLAHTTKRCPLRYAVAYRQYAEAAQYRLEHPEDLL